MRFRVAADKPPPKETNESKDEPAHGDKVAPKLPAQVAPHWAAAFEEGARKRTASPAPAPVPGRAPVPEAPPSPPASPAAAPTSASGAAAEGDDTSSLSTEAYNSEDEHGARAAEVAAAAAAAAGGAKHVPALSAEEREAHFRGELAGKRWRVAEVRADGNCLFRAVAYAAWNDEELHGDLRARVMDYVAQQRDYFSQFVAEDFPRYVRRKRRNGTHGNHVELQAAADLLGARIEVYAYCLTPSVVVVPAGGHSAGPVLRLSFHRGSHYNAVVGTRPADLCPKKLAAAAVRLPPERSADDARIAALADSLATEEELEQVALELSIAEHRREQRNRHGAASSSSAGAGASGASASAGASSWRAHAPMEELEESLHAVKLRGSNSGGAGSSAGPSSAPRPHDKQ